MANAVLEHAKTGRSKCATTGAEIAQGDPRVGFEIWRIGRRCMTYQTPRAFLDGIRVGIAEDSRSKCKFSGAPLSKGDLILVFKTGGAKGEKPTLQVCSLEATAAFIADVAQSVDSKFQVKNVDGFKALSSDLQVKVAKVLTFSGGGRSSSKVTKKRPASSSVGGTFVGAKRVRQ